MKSMNPLFALVGEAHGYSRAATIHPCSPGTHVGPRRADSLLYKAKVYAPFVSLLMLMITATWAFTSHDKRITVLEVTAAEQSVQVDKNTDTLSSIKEWIPVVDVKFDVLLKHFGISVPSPAK